MIEIPLTQGKKAVVDDIDIDLSTGLKWQAHREGRISNMVWYAVQGGPRTSRKRSHWRKRCRRQNSEAILLREMPQRDQGGGLITFAPLTIPA